MTEQEISAAYPVALKVASDYVKTNMVECELSKWLYWDNWHEIAFYFLVQSGVPKSNMIIVIRHGRFYACTSYIFDFYRSRLLDKYGRKILNEATT